MEKHFDLVIKNARVVRPNKTSVDRCDIAVAGGKIARVAPDIPPRKYSTPKIFSPSPGASMLTCTSASISP